MFPTPSPKNVLGYFKSISALNGKKSIKAKVSTKQIRG